MGTTRVSLWRTAARAWSRSGAGAVRTSESVIGVDAILGDAEFQEGLALGASAKSADRASEGQHYRLAGLNLLAAIVIYWNTAHLGEAVGYRKHAGLTVEPELLAHISPLGWAHILLTGEYQWPKRR